MSFRILVRGFGISSCEIDSWNRLPMYAPSAKICRTLLCSWIHDARDCTNFVASAKLTQYGIVTCTAWPWIWMRTERVPRRFWKRTRPIPSISSCFTAICYRIVILRRLISTRPAVGTKFTMPGLVMLLETLSAFTMFSSNSRFMSEPFCIAKECLPLKTT